MSNKRSLKNPLALALGLVLKEMREESSRSAEDIAEALDVSASTYRLFESGSNNLRPVYAPRLLQEKAFRKIEFSPLAILLQATHSLESLWEEEEHLADALKKLGKFESPLDRIRAELEREIRTHDELEADDVRATVIQLGLDNHLRQFLTSPIFSQEIESRAALTTKRFLKETSPFYFDAAAKLLSDLRRSEPLINSSKVGEWEKENADRIVNARAVIQDLWVFFHEGNLRHYDFRYALNRKLLDENVTIRVIYNTFSRGVDNVLSPDKFKSRMVNMLYNFYAWKTNSRKEVGKQAVKILIDETFKFSRVSRSEIRPLLTANKNVYGNTKRYDSLWIFTLLPFRTRVGMGDTTKEDTKERILQKESNEEKKYVEEISYNAVNLISSEFDEVWNSLDDREINKMVQL